MFRKLMPKKDSFFLSMEQGAQKAVDIVEEFRGLLDHMDEAEERVERIKGKEHEADTLLHEVLSTLHRTFVTPLDRNDISTILKRIDDIVDLVEGAAQRIFHYELKTARPPIKLLTEMLAQQVALVLQAVTGLQDMKHADELRKHLIEINTIENRADQALRAAIGGLFREEKDPLLVIKWKEVYEHLEKATDRCEDVADMIENILLEYT